jgi:tetratricopeptide (TPR) repeat protein
MAVIEQVLPTYLPKLAALAQGKAPSKHASTISELTTHGYLLAGLVALDQYNLVAMEVYSQLAIKHSRMYSDISHDFNLYAAALKQYATMLQIAKNPTQAFQTYQRALPFLDQVSPLLRSRIYQGLARTSAQIGLEQKAETYIRKAQETFPSDFEKDISYLYADSGLSVLYMYEGLSYLDLDQPEKAMETYTQVIDGETLTAKIPVGQLTHLEFINLLGSTAVALRDQERSCKYLEVASSRAKAMNSEWGLSDAREVYQKMRLIWPKDAHIKALRQLF